MNQDNRDKKHPMHHFADSVNRSMFGDLKALTRGGCLTNLITLLIVIIVVFGGLFILSQCSR